MSTHAAVIPLALHVLKIAAQIYLVCSPPRRDAHRGTAPDTEPLGRGLACAREDSRVQGNAQLCSLPLSGLEKLREGSALAWGAVQCRDSPGQSRVGPWAGGSLGLEFDVVSQAGQDQAKPGHSLSTDPLCTLGQQPCSNPDWSNTAGGSSG